MPIIFHSILSHFQSLFFRIAAERALKKEKSGLTHSFCLVLLLRERRVLIT